MGVTVRVVLASSLFAVACGPQVPFGDDGIHPSLDEASSASGAETGPIVPDESDNDDTIVDFDFGGASPEPSKLDILVVIDNSATMGDAQIAITRALVELVGRLEASSVDAQVMFTTTDMGNPLCEPHQKPDYAPAKGAPTTTACVARLNRFTGVGDDPQTRDDVCKELCPSDVAPADPFVAFGGSDEDNVPDGPAGDIDGDGDDDSMAAHAVACLAPQGIDGCGFEQPLEAMLQALNPAAHWNVGDRPFLREGATLAIVLATDEMDCSMDDYSVMYDPAYQELDVAGLPRQTSAICWNAGMSCAPADPYDTWSGCEPTEAPLMPTWRYSEYLQQELGGREVVMIAITGVPLVDERSPVPPYEPVAGGLDDLLLRGWWAADLLPPDLADGLDVGDKRLEFKAGPGCTDYAEQPPRIVQAIPNPRVNEVCSALDVTGGEAAVRCCVESICDPQIRLDCIDGWVSQYELEPPYG
jgi:hypothetical protein